MKKSLPPFRLRRRLLQLPLDEFLALSDQSYAWASRLAKACCAAGGIVVALAYSAWAMADRVDPSAGDWIRTVLYAAMFATFFYAGSIIQLIDRGVLRRCSNAKMMRDFASRHSLEP